MLGKIGKLGKTWGKLEVVKKLEKTKGWALEKLWKFEKWEFSAGPGTRKLLQLFFKTICKLGKNQGTLMVSEGLLFFG